MSAPVAPTIAAPPTQMTPPSESSSDDDVPLIQLIQGKKKANKKPTPPTAPTLTPEAEIVHTDDEMEDDLDMKPAAAAATTTTPALTGTLKKNDIIKTMVNGITWMQAVLVELLNNGHYHHNWHHKTSVCGVHICDGSDLDGKLPLRFYFEAAFPMSYLPTIVRLMNEELAAAYLQPTNVTEMIRFIGILLLIPRLPPLQ